ncbi:hypothetical protein NNJEOMEG_01804 [Fundidesulfovibrio magnetotacticus]|uniref:Fido domain-containing protein n=1 Tax=Fundidesulfovibrio magnetotacticus TaxID=2730080 RepID=A0A6V8LVY0_9BACT|nr:Fic family protein [Fundidesulfovibrio magnetotacticus]GFK93966.1 hypothetical protein NNJEOMEG_01804 [Fundidesulfovibrio magnetotacticus]
MSRSRDKALFIARKNMAGLVYYFQALEGMPFTLPEVQTYLQGITVGGHKVSDQDKLKQQALAWQHLIRIVEEDAFEFTKHVACELNAIVAKDEAAVPGRFRQGAVWIMGTDYAPPDHATLDARFEGLRARVGATRHTFTAGVLVALDMARNQYFFDGNKRTGLLMMNGLFLSKGLMPFSVPAKSLLEYNEKMLRFYETGEEDEMLRFFETQYAREYPGFSFESGA